MSRLAPVTRDQLSSADQAIWDRVSKIRSLQGPSGILMHAPPLLDKFEVMADYFRDEAHIAAADRELTILVIAREFEARYAWSRHEPQAKAAGASPAAIESIRAKAGLDAFGEHEGLLVEIGRALCRDRELSAELYARAEAALGTRSLVDLIALIGHYTLVGIIIRAFAIPVPDDRPTF